MLLRRLRASVRTVQDAPLSDDPAPQDESVVEPRTAGVRRVAGGARSYLRRYAWLLLAAAAALVLLRVVEFEPPTQVRVDDAPIDLVGDAPPQAFAGPLDNPQAVQLRASLRLYPRSDLDVREPDPALDGRARLLSQPVVTTIYATQATLDQTVRLGKLEIDLGLIGTPRLGEATGKRTPALTLEHELTVTSRRTRRFRAPERALHLHTRGTLTDLEDRPHRWVFVIEDELFALDLELHRGR